MEQEREKNVSQDLWYTEEGWLDYLKSRRYLRLDRSSPFSMLEFQEYVEEYFLPLMDHSEKLGYKAFLMVHDGKSIHDSAQSIGVDDHKCREWIGRFCNLFCTTATPDLFSYLPDELASSMECQRRGRDSRTAHHLHGLREIATVHPRKSDCSTYVPKEKVNVDPDLAEEILLQMRKTQAFEVIVRWAMRRGVEREEAEQEILIGMYNGLRTFDSSKASLKGFLTLVAKKRISTRVRHDMEIRRRRIENLTYEEWMALLPPRGRTPSEEKLDNMKGTVKSFTSLEMRAVRSRIRGESYVQAGLFMEEPQGQNDSRRLRGGAKAIDNALCRVVKKSRRGSKALFS